MHKAHFWRGYFERMFKPHLQRTLQVLEMRLLPTFDGIEVEATAMQEKTYVDLMSMPVDPDITDGSMLGDAAFEAAYDHYSGMQAVRQSLINAFGPLLFHTKEQQLIAVHRKEVLRPQDENDNRLLQVKVLQKRLSGEGLDLTRLSTWASREELKPVSNTVKHAVGDSPTSSGQCGRTSSKWTVRPAQQTRSGMPIRDASITPCPAKTCT